MAKIYIKQITHQKIIEVLQNLIDQFRKLDPNTKVDSFLIEKISSFEMNMINWLTLQELEEKTPRQKLKETLDKNSKKWNELPEWVKKAFNL